MLDLPPLCIHVMPSMVPCTLALSTRVLHNHAFLSPMYLALCMGERTKGAVSVLENLLGHVVRGEEGPPRSRLGYFIRMEDLAVFRFQGFSRLLESTEWVQNREAQVCVMRASYLSCPHSPITRTHAQRPYRRRASPTTLQS